MGVPGLRALARIDEAHKRGGLGWRDAALTVVDHGQSLPAHAVGMGVVTEVTMP